MSQIGWTEDIASSPTRKIDMEEIFILVDANGGNAGEWYFLEILDYKNLLHSKTNHRVDVLNKVIEYIER